jgi:general secretion pathway protein G
MLRREKGFTLIELLIVVAIIGIIAAIAVPNLLTAIQRSKRSRTAADIRAIGTALGSYLVDYNHYPTAILDGDDIHADFEMYYSGATNDGWGTQFAYTLDGSDDYTLLSGGKDQAVGYTDSEFDSDITYYNGQFTGPASLVD